MKIAFTCVLLMVATTALAAPKREHEPARDILGLKLSMNEEDAKKRLREIGTFVRDEAGWQEVWRVRDDRFANVIVGFGKDEKLNYITAVAREDKDAKRVRYDKIGDVKEARQMGDVKIKVFNYQWELPAAKGSPRMRVVAAGRDPKFLKTHSLKNLENSPAKAEKD